MDNVSSTHYLNIFVEQGTFHIEEHPSKPEGSSAISTLESIAKTIEGIRQDKLNYTEGYSDEYSDLSKEGLLEVLMEKATLIADGYRKKRETLSFLEKFFSQNEQNTINKIESRLISPPVLPYLVNSDKKSPLTDVIQEILRFLEVPDLGTFGQLNRQGNLQQKVAILNRAQTYGYEGNNKLEATNYLREIFNHIIELHKFIYRHCMPDNFEWISKEQALRDIINLNIYDFCKLCQIQDTYDDTLQKLCKIFKPKKTLTITHTIDPIEIRKRGLSDFLERAVDGSVSAQKEALPMELNLVEILLQNGAVVTLSNFEQSYGHIELFELFLKYKIDIPLPRGWEHCTLLTYYITQGGSDFVELLLTYGSPIDQKDSKAISPLGSAVIAGFTDIVKMLLEHEASPYEVLEAPFKEESLLTETLIAGNVDIAELFFQAGVPLNLSLKNGTCLLNKLALAGNVEAMQFLLGKGVDFTPVKLALEHIIKEMESNLLAQKKLVSNLESSSVTFVVSLQISYEHKIFKRMENKFLKMKKFVSNLKLSV